MLFEDVEKLYIIKNGVTYTPITTVKRKYDINGLVYGDHTIIKTAEEVYQECINPPITPKTELEIIQENQVLMQKAIDDLIFGGVL